MWFPDAEAGEPSEPLLPSSAPGDQLGPLSEPTGPVAARSCVDGPGRPAAPPTEENPTQLPGRFPPPESPRRPPPPLYGPPRPPRSVPGWLGAVVLSAVVGAVVGGALVGLVASRAPETIVREQFPTRSPRPTLGDVQTILAHVLPAVVSISANGVPAGLFGVAEGEGTGMIIAPGGVVLTNDHVVARAKTLSVTLYGQSIAFRARLIGADPANDIALLQIEGAGPNLPTVRFGDSAAARQGDSVLAVGNALALAGGPTVTEGIVAAKGRSFSITTDAGATEHLAGLIQTDAPINPGNSGGPLLDASAEVIAMNTAVASSSAGNAPAQNVGFAIPVDQIRPIVSELLAARGPRTTAR